MMRLRNKKTGEIVEREQFILTKHIKGDGSWEDGSYNSIAELNEEWEDYTPKEPLIKDEKIRNVVKAWAEANTYCSLLYNKEKDCLYSPYGSDDYDLSVSIKFDEDGMFKGLENGKEYTIEELCGEDQ